MSYKIWKDILSPMLWQALCLADSWPDRQGWLHEQECPAELFLYLQGRWSVHGQTCERGMPAENYCCWDTLHTGLPERETCSECGWIGWFWQFNKVVISWYYQPVSGNIRIGKQNLQWKSIRIYVYMQSLGKTLQVSNLIVYLPLNVLKPCSFLKLECSFVYLK